MDISRLLTYDEENASDDTDQHRSGPDTTTSNGDALPVAKRRPSPPRRRKATLTTMRAQVAAYECALANLPHVLRDTDEIASTSGEDTERRDHNKCGDAQRMREFLRRAFELTQEAKQEREIGAELLRLLKHYRESRSKIQKLMRGLVLDDWHWACERWRALSSKCFIPWTKSQCYRVVDETLATIESEKRAVFGTETGADFFGWSDVHRLDNDQHSVRFSARKTLQHSDIKECADRTWALYEDGEHMNKDNSGADAGYFHQILQRVSPDLVILQTIEKYPFVEKIAHSLSMAFRVQTKTGYTIALRSIQSFPLQNFMKSDGLSLSREFYWTTLDVAHRDRLGECTAILVTFSGSVGSDDPTYARRWLNEIMVSLVRSEIQVMDTPMLSIEASTEDRNAVGP